MKNIRFTGRAIMRFETTPLEYLEMSDLAYQDYNLENSLQHQLLSDLGWRVHLTPKKKDYLRKGKGGYHGIVYIHEKRKEIACAHRGTASLSAIEADITLLVEQKIHAQITEAIELCLDVEVKELLKKDYSLTFTGHSLGGFLATSCLYFCQRADLLNSQGEHLYYPNSKAVVFDPAGSQMLLSTLEPYAISHAGLGNKGIKNLNILHFVSLPNYVNAYAPHPGGTIYGLLPTHIRLKTMNPISYLQQTHALATLRRCFVTLNSDSSNAGYPKAEQCRKMNDWPLINFRELSSLSTIFGAVSAPLKLGIDILQALAKIVGYHSQRVPYFECLGGGEEYRRALGLAVEAAKTNGTIVVPELMSTLSSHYAMQNSRYNAQLHRLHFGKDIEEFLMDYATYLQNTAETVLFAQEYRLTDSDRHLLDSYQINSCGEISLSSANASIFTFRQKVARLFSEKRLNARSVKCWIRNKIAHLPDDIKKMQNRLEKLENKFLHSSLYFSRGQGSSAALIAKFSERYQDAHAHKKPTVKNFKNVKLN